MLDQIDGIGELINGLSRGRAPVSPLAAINAPHIATVSVPATPACIVLIVGIPDFVVRINCFQVV